MDDNKETPVPVDETIEAPDETLPDLPPQLTGVFSIPLLQMWEEQLRGELEGYAGLASMDTYDQFMRSWSNWIKYTEVEKVRRQLSLLAMESLEHFDRGVEFAIQGDPRSREEIWGDAENDWELNKKIRRSSLFM